MTYPYEEDPLSPEMKLCHEVVYWLNMLAHFKRTGHGESEDKSCDEECCSHCGGVIELWTMHIALEEVLREPRIQQLSASLEEIR